MLALQFLENEIEECGIPVCICQQDAGAPIEED
jgi:hypothetical protein